MPIGSSKIACLVLFWIPLGRCMLADPARAPVVEIDCFLLVKMMRFK